MQTKWMCRDCADESTRAMKDGHNIYVVKADAR